MVRANFSVRFFVYAKLYADVSRCVCVCVFEYSCKGNFFMCVCVQLLRLLDSSNFGQVHFGMLRGSTEVAVKTAKAGQMSTRAFLGEATKMRTVWV